MKQPAVVLFGISQRGCLCRPARIDAIVAALLSTISPSVYHIAGVAAYVLGLTIAVTGALLIKAARALDRILDDRSASSTHVKTKTIN
jgi:hypothetical protein